MYLGKNNIFTKKILSKLINYYFRELDRDGDGRVSYKDFEIAMDYIDDEL